MKYSFTDRIRYSEADENEKLSLFHLMAYMQDCSIFHAEAGGVGLDWIQENGQGWMLADLQLKIFDYPGVGEKIRVSTWAYGFRHCIGDRNFTIEREDGTPVAHANSEWIYMDIRVGKPIRVAQSQLDGYGIEADLRLTDDFGKRKIRIPEHGQSVEPFRVLAHQLDSNHHMNNAHYLQMAESCLPPHEKPGSLRAEFKNQARLGDMVYPVVYTLEDGYLVTMNDAEGKPYFVCEMK